MLSLDSKQYNLYEVTFEVKCYFIVLRCSVYQWAMLWIYIHNVWNNQLPNTKYQTCKPWFAFVFHFVPYYYLTTTYMHVQTVTNKPFYIIIKTVYKQIHSYGKIFQAVHLFICKFGGCNFQLIYVIILGTTIAYFGGKT